MTRTELREPSNSTFSRMKSDLRRAPPSTVMHSRSAVSTVSTSCRRVPVDCPCSSVLLHMPSRLVRLDLLDLGDEGGASDARLPPGLCMHAALDRCWPSCLDLGQQISAQHCWTRLHSTVARQANDNTCMAQLHWASSACSDVATGSKYPAWGHYAGLAKQSKKQICSTCIPASDTPECADLHRALCGLSATACLLRCHDSIKLVHERAHGHWRGEPASEVETLAGDLDRGDHAGLRRISHASPA